MFSLSSLYKDYAHQSPQSLIDLFESELSDYSEFGYADAINALKECISFTEDYINHNLKDADNKAKNEKGEYVRFSGEPYINHCLRVALILIHERLFDENVLKAAIMHDLFEDTTFSYDEAYKMYNSEVADLIDCVSNVSESEENQTKNRSSSDNTEESSVSDKSNPFAYASTSVFTQAEVDYSTTIMKCNEHRMAFYIKFADRLDNLMTLDAMPLDKQRQKIEDTKSYLYPLLSKFKANRFRKYFDNAIFKIEQSRGELSNPNYFNLINTKLEEFRAIPSVLSTFENVKTALKSHFYDIRLVRPTAYEIYKHLKSANIRIGSFSQSDIIYDIYLISQNKTPRLSEILIKFTVDPLNEYSVEEVGKDEFYFMDDLRNHYRVIVASYNDFTRTQYGDTDAALVIAMPNEIYDKLVLDEMTVYTSDNEKKVIPAGSTVIDYAFYLDDKTAEHMIGALVNNKNVPLYTRLHNGDVIELIIGDYPKVEISIDWIALCATRKAKLALCEIVKKKISELVNKINTLEN